MKLETISKLICSTRTKLPVEPEKLWHHLLDSWAQRIVTLENSHEMHEQRNQRAEGENIKFNEVRQFAYVLEAEEERVLI